MRNNGSGPKTHAQALARWNERYTAQGYLFGETPNAYLVSNADLLPKAGRALSVADGEGRNSTWLAKQGLKVDAFDFSPVAVDKARALAQQQGVEVDYAVADALALKWPRAMYDVIVAIFIQFATAEERRRLFTKVQAALKPGGIFILQGYRAEQRQYGTGGPSEVSQLYTADGLRAELSGLSIIDLAVYDTEIYEGTGHSGMSALVGLVGRKG
jgi:SAM-dependent methyltransferase